MIALCGPLFDLTHEIFHEDCSWVSKVTLFLEVSCVLIPYCTTLRMFVGFPREVCRDNPSGDIAFTKLYPGPSTKSCWIISFFADEVTDSTYSHDGGSPNLISVKIFVLVMGRNTLFHVAGTDDVK